MTEKESLVTDSGKMRCTVTFWFLRISDERRTLHDSLRNVSYFWGCILHSVCEAVVNASEQHFHLQCQLSLLCNDLCGKLGFSAAAAGSEVSGEF